MTDLTADFVYCRLHGSEQLYVSGYDDAALQRWAERIHAWRRGQELPGDYQVAAPLASMGRARDVYFYFDNDAKVRAPVDARRLNELLGADVVVAPVPV